MCGIAGILREREALIPEADLRRMATALEHRGPGVCGAWVGAEVGFSHTRPCGMFAFHGNFRCDPSLPGLLWHQTTALCSSCWRVKFASDAKSLAAAGWY